MSSNRFLRIARRIAAEDKELFDALMEFERTKRVRTKEHLDFTIDRVVVSKFRKFCKEKGYNMSAKVEQAIRKILSEES